MARCECCFASLRIEEVVDYWFMGESVGICADCYDLITGRYEYADNSKDVNSDKQGENSLPSTS